MNVADQDVFTFPSESELKEPLGLQEVQRRIRDLVAVLSDFNKLRDKDRYAVCPTECFRLTLTLCYPLQGRNLDEHTRSRMNTKLFAFSHMFFWLLSGAARI